MDDIMRDVPADAGSMLPRSPRSKGPAELVQHERSVAVEGGGDEDAPALDASARRGLAAFLVAADRLSPDGDDDAAPDGAGVRAFPGGSVSRSDEDDSPPEQAGEGEVAAESSADSAPSDEPADLPADQPADQPDDRPELAAGVEAVAGSAGPVDDGDDAAVNRAGDAAEADASAADAADQPLDADEIEAALARDADTLELDPEEVPDGAAGDDGLPAVPELTDPAAVARIVHVLVLTQREGLSIMRLAQACNTTQKQVEQAVELLREQLAEAGTALELVRTGDTIRLMSSAEVFPYLQRLKGVKKLEKLSPAALETLAVIAYRQPVMRAEIEAIRGVKAGPMLRTLLQHKLVRITGRADVPGRPLQYGTSDHFLERFGLSSLQELPSLKEFKNLG